MARRAAQRQVISFEPRAVIEREDGQMARQHVDGVILGKRQADLERRRQMEILRIVAGVALALEPELFIGAAARRQMLGETPRRHLQPAMRRRTAGRERAHAGHIAAGGEGGEPRQIDDADRLLEVALQHATERNPLPRLEVQRAVAIAVGDVVEGEKLCRVEPAARNAHRQGKVMPRSRRDAMQSQELGAVRAEPGRGVRQLDGKQPELGSGRCVVRLHGSPHSFPASAGQAALALAAFLKRPQAELKSALWINLVCQRQNVNWIYYT
jgi:hypothetical protein